MQTRKVSAIKIGNNFEVQPVADYSAADIGEMIRDAETAMGEAGMERSPENLSRVIADETGITLNIKAL